MARFYADENFDVATVENLRSLGHDVTTVQDEGRRGDSDDQVLALATQQGRAVLTHDRRDFERLHRLDSNHAGILSCTLDDAAALAARIDQAVASTSVVRQHIRVNRLP
jgi:predicted nuclease of predicted toxin-antitoxin system